MLKDMTRLRELWPVEVFEHMRCHQQDLERLRNPRKRIMCKPDRCRVGFVESDPGRHVSSCGPATSDLVQLWRCPIAWCTTWKGSPQDCLEHVRSGHDAPWVEKTASMRSMPPVDGPTTALVGFTADRTLRHINRYAAVQ